MKKPYHYSHRMVKLDKEKKKEEIWLSPMTKAHAPTENETKWQLKNATRNIDNTTIADRLKTVSLINNSHPTGAIKPVYEI